MNNNNMEGPQFTQYTSGSPKPKFASEKSKQEPEEGLKEEQDEEVVPEDLQMDLDFEKQIQQRPEDKKKIEKIKEYLLNLFK